VILAQFIYAIRRYSNSRGLLRTIDAALEKIAVFEKLDAKMVSEIKQGTENKIPPTYWKVERPRPRARPERENRETGAV